jgi:hypothetical protein
VLHIVPQIRYLGFSHLREEGSLDYNGGFVRLQIHVNFDTIINRQQPPSQAGSLKATHQQRHYLEQQISKAEYTNTQQDLTVG